MRRLGAACAVMVWALTGCAPETMNPASPVEPTQDVSPGAQPPSTEAGEPTASSGPSLQPPPDADDESAVFVALLDHPGESGFTAEAPWTGNVVVESVCLGAGNVTYEIELTGPEPGVQSVHRGLAQCGPGSTTTTSVTRVTEGAQYQISVTPDPGVTDGWLALRIMQGPQPSQTNE